MEPEYEFKPNTYESFMRHYLQYYGYYSGQNSKSNEAYNWPLSVPSVDMSSDLSDTSESDEEEIYIHKKEKYSSVLDEDLLKTTQLVYTYNSFGHMAPKLREPRQLYALSSEVNLKQAPRWPADIHVVESRVRHLHTSPGYAEPMYEPYGLEATPMVRGDNMGSVIFNYEPSATCFERSKMGGQRVESEISQSDDDFPSSLQFESRFESGNLARVIQVRENDYELWMRNDLYTNKYTQWFYFRVTNAQVGPTYRFTIVNFVKPDSLYNMGMRPLIYSERNAEDHGIGWVRAGNDIKYYKNNKIYQSLKGEKSYYSLTWTIKFDRQDDRVYFAHCYPYTYSDLQEYLSSLSNDARISQFCKQRVLCQTLAGNFVYVLTVTSPIVDTKTAQFKKVVVVTARVHPGESNSSWMMKGLIDYLVGTSLDAQLLRDIFVFKIIPMLNPDGVIVGNYRCSLSGRDLNRNYRTKLKDAFPPVWHTRNMISRIQEEKDVILYCDFHGHSRKQNVFIYGCENRRNPTKRFHERIFPAMLGKNAYNKFKFDSCKFKVQKSKEGTGRVVMWNMGILNSFTMEATFCGSTLEEKKRSHFNILDYEDMGFHFLDTILDYCDPDKAKEHNIMIHLKEKIKLEIMEKLRLKGENVTDIDINSSELLSLLDESSDGGSDSSVSDGLPAHLKVPRIRDHRKVKKKWRTRRERDKIRTGDNNDVKANDSQSVKVKSSKSTMTGENSQMNRRITETHLCSQSVPRICKQEESLPKSMERDKESNFTPNVHSTFGQELTTRRIYLHDVRDSYFNCGTDLCKPSNFVHPYLKYAIGGRVKIIHDSDFMVNNPFTGNLCYEMQSISIPAFDNPCMMLTAPPKPCLVIKALQPQTVLPDQLFRLHQAKYHKNNMIRKPYAMKRAIPPVSGSNNTMHNLVRSIRQGSKPTYNKVKDISPEQQTEISFDKKLNTEQPDGSYSDNLDVKNFISCPINESHHNDANNGTAFTSKSNIYHSENCKCTMKVNEGDDNTDDLTPENIQSKDSDDSQVKKSNTQFTQKIGKTQPKKNFHNTSYQRPAAVVAPVLQSKYKVERHYLAKYSEKKQEVSKTIREMPASASTAKVSLLISKDHGKLPTMHKNISK